MKRYRHILVATDGSALAGRAARTAASLAREFDARLTGLFVLAEGVPTLLSGDKLFANGVISPRLRERARREAGHALARVEREARAAGVPCATLKRLSRRPWRAILAAARSSKCDLIVVAPHRRRGVRALMHASQTARVIAHSTVPVLVCGRASPTSCTSAPRRARQT